MQCRCFRHWKHTSTFTNERNGQLFIEMSLMADNTYLTLTLTLLYFLGEGHGGVLRVRGSPADLSPAPRTWLCLHLNI